MTSQDHDLTPPVAADAPAINVPASPPRRDPVEDADASFTRKRPRLDCGSTALRAMSTDPASPTLPTAAPHEQQVEMTIRPHPPSSPMAAGDEAPGNTHGPHCSPVPPPNQSPIAIASSDEGSTSPPVEIIVDDEDASFTVLVDPDEHFRQFPFNSSRNCCVMVRELTAHIEKATNIEAHILPALTQWLSEIPNHEVEAAAFFIARDEFWRCFADLVGVTLHRSRHPLGGKFDDAQVDDIFTEFFSAYVRTCSSMFLVDADQLSRPRTEELYPYILLSEAHLRNLSILLHSEKSPLSHLLRRDYAIDATDMSQQLRTKFVSSQGAQNLLRLTEAAFEQVERSTENEIALHASRLFSALGWFMHESPDSATMYINFHVYCRRVLRFFSKYGGKLSNLSQTTDSIVTRELILQHTELLYKLCGWDGGIAAQLVETFLDFHDAETSTSPSSAEEPTHYDPNNYREDPTAFPALVSYAWKFKILRKCITKGKMDLRVLSIAAMDGALVEIWKELGTSDPSARRHPVLQYLADFLLQGRVVDYIVSVDSHPQLISRSGNIVGFLVVTHRWSDSQADTIWNTVANSPDPRVVTATMAMLRSIVGLMLPRDLLHLCKKLYELPLERYTMEILQFLREVSKYLVSKAPQMEVDYELRPWSVCVRMLRDTAPSRHADKDRLDLHAEASDQLHGLLHIIPENERHAIYEDCARNIADRTNQATGSVRVIYILAAALHSGDGLFFEGNEQLSRQVLQEIPRLVEAEVAAGPYPYQELVLQYRLELLALLICRAGLAISADLYNDIWHYTVGPGALSDAARNIAWAQFLQTIKLTPKNDFCEKLIGSYVPNLDPHFFTDGLFEFVANYNFPTNRLHTETEEGNITVVQNPGHDLLWLLMTESLPESPIGDRAARLLATRYAKLHESAGGLLPEVEAAHVALVEKCMEELRSASRTARNEPLTSTKSEIRCQKILLFQKLLLECIRQQPELNRSRRADSKVDEMDVPFGNAVTIKYQCGSDRHSVSMAADHTLEDLYKRLCHATNFSKINLFAKGQRLSLATSATQKLSELDFGGQLLIQRAEGAEVTRPLLESKAGTSVFECTLLEYFDELFELMESDDAISQMLFDFLAFFPPRVAFTDMVSTGKAQSEVLFPPGKSFQARYAARALQTGLVEQIRGSSLNEAFLANAVRHLNAALLNPRLMSDPISSFQELRLAAILVHVLLEFLRAERPSHDISETYFPDGNRLATRLIGILSVAIEYNEEATFVQNSYAAILEASLHSCTVWAEFMKNPMTPRIHRALLLGDSRQHVREHVARKITSVCGGDLPMTCPITKAEIASCFWRIIYDILPDTVLQPERSQQLFEVAEHVFRTNDEYERKEGALRSFLTSWGELLLGHDHQAFAGRDTIDFVVFGFTKLMLACVLSIKSFKKPLKIGTLMEQIFRKFLFAESASASDSTAISCQVLDPDTRHELYELALALVDDKHADGHGTDVRSSYGRLLEMASEVEGREIDSVMPAVAVDRSMEVRSSTGYVGLYNPRNICYMNSLMTQLYMNLSFRDFILGLEVQEARGSQKLLFETQRLFTQMQNSVCKSADPREFAACVKSLELTPIDVNVQMDVDEFFNLLFDQWETQLVRAEDKRKFRSFYGGQTLNQIKSKECDHVSERTEPFFTVQCDVQGKANLQESLGAFIKGDVMEGDNKYKCESCGGRLVDAVKRTCLKEIPDNLILHLKRFDFDLNDWSRRKIYDYFEFPQSFDISDYHVDHLSDPSEPREHDIFDLVGILVHSGTCESGHYYSYIRERPSSRGSSTPTWVEFDDSNVTPFDPTEIAQRAFGGPTDDTYNQHFKIFSAYMLFYQRRNTVEMEQKDWVAPAKGQPFKVPAPEMLLKEVANYNSGFIREYCLFDLGHSRFVRQLHAMSRTINNGTCSEDHSQENRALDIVLTHQSRIVWRQQTPELFTETVSQLRRSVLSCMTCCTTVLQFFADKHYALINLIVRCMHPTVRSQMQKFLVECLEFLREKEPSVYGLGNTDSDMDLDSAAPPHGVLMAVIARLRWVVNESAINTRGWDDLYTALDHIASMGHTETAILLDYGFLDFCTKLFCMQSYKPFQEEAWDLARVMTGKRKGIFNMLIAFVSTLLSQVDINLPPFPLLFNSSPQSQNRLSLLDRERMKFPMAYREKQIMLYFDSDVNAMAVLDKILEMFDHTKTDHFYPGDIVRWILGSRDPSVQTHLFGTLTEGIGIDPPYCDAYVRAGIPFCEGSPSLEHVQKYLGTVARAIASPTRIDGGCTPSGDVVLKLLTALLGMKNEALFRQRHPYIFYQYLMSKSRVYAMPLLMHPMLSIRKGSHAFLLELFLNHGELPHEILVIKWRLMRELVRELSRRIVYESNSGIMRSHMGPLISTCQSLAHALYVLSESEDPGLEQYKEDGDFLIFQEFRTEVESRLRTWPDEATPPSTVETIDQSDYGSESDDPQEFQN
ncbi:ubiquitin C-terminal hydrolase-like protein [Plenodomus tracheiphilus IPT5]|uniref:Ubiquitin C-terminal hydrolase-like protein n=1 Tax=Plenodomus tracheiphilus IPT5 TaxID=1408161 RepID=A0A6A7BE93_9PLEO|nr:ubiquitin C-terminal hydrolase-like protein [Plenodomus tracheiphilus IPT5]